MKEGDGGMRSNAKHAPVSALAINPRETLKHKAIAPGQTIKGRLP